MGYSLLVICRVQRTKENEGMGRGWKGFFKGLRQKGEVLRTGGGGGVGFAIKQNKNGTSPW